MQEALRQGAEAEERQKAEQVAAAQTAADLQRLRQVSLPPTPQNMRIYITVR